MPSRIAIDTNIFIHLTNPQENPDSHIDQLLSHLAKSEPRLCIDSKSKIANEYHEKLGARIRDASDQSIALVLIRFWMNPDLREVIEMDSEELLAKRIEDVIREPDEQVDRAFVYVSCKSGCPLVTNDVAHIWSRRAELKSKTRKLRGGDGWAILNSSEAVNTLVRGGAS